MVTRKTFRRRTSGYSIHDRAYLCSGPGGSFEAYDITHSGVLDVDRSYHPIATHLSRPKWDEIREAWKELRAEIMADFQTHAPGRRPWAWWVIESSQDTEPEDQLQFLTDNGLLSASEKLALSRQGIST